MKKKKCAKCKKYREHEMFNKWKGTSDGLYTRCKDCIREENGSVKRRVKERYINKILKRWCCGCKKYQKKTFFYLSKCYRHGISDECKGCLRKKANTELAKTRQKGKRQLVKMEVIIHYGGNPPQCACCGEKTYEFLCIDHINGGGGKHRKSFKNGHYMNWIRKNYPKDLQVLCHNCNMAKGFYGQCPHQNAIKQPIQ